MSEKVEAWEKCYEDIIKEVEGWRDELDGVKKENDALKEKIAAALKDLGDPKAEPVDPPKPAEPTTS